MNISDMNISDIIVDISVDIFSPAQFSVMNISDISADISVDVFRPAQWNKMLILVESHIPNDTEYICNVLLVYIVRNYSE